MRHPFSTDFSGNMRGSCSYCPYSIEEPTTPGNFLFFFITFLRLPVTKKPLFLKRLKLVCFLECPGLKEWKECPSLFVIYWNKK